MRAIFIVVFRSAKYDPLAHQLQLYSLAALFPATAYFKVKLWETTTCHFNRID